MREGKNRKGRRMGRTDINISWRPVMTQLGLGNAPRSASKDIVLRGSRRRHKFKDDSPPRPLWGRCLPKNPDLPVVDQVDQERWRRERGLER